MKGYFSLGDDLGKELNKLNKKNAHQFKLTQDSPRKRKSGSRYYKRTIRKLRRQLAF